MSQRLRDKVVIVTGGTRGMGEAGVRGIVAHGGKVVFGGRDEAAGNAIAESLDDDALYVPQDVASRADWERIVGLALSRFGSITGLVNNAGAPSKQLLGDITDDEANRTMQVNQLGPILGMQHVAPHMRAAGGGSIINIASAAAVRAHVANSVYSATKAALFGASRAIALELAPDNIRVNVIVPGFFATKLLDDASSGKGREMGAQLTPMKRTAEPQEMVGPVVFLLSDESSFVTGAELTVDGGYTM